MLTSVAYSHRLNRGRTVHNDDYEHPLFKDLTKPLDADGNRPHAESNGLYIYRFSSSEIKQDIFKDVVGIDGWDRQVRFNTNIVRVENASDRDGAPRLKSLELDPVYHADLFVLSRIRQRPTPKLDAAGAFEGYDTYDAILGLLSFKEAPDFENPRGGIDGKPNIYRVRLRATFDNGNLIGTLVDITVTDRPEPPDVGLTDLQVTPPDPIVANPPVVIDPPAVIPSVIEDTNLESAIRQKLGLAATAEITAGTLQRLTTLRAVNAGITRLAGLQGATNLTELLLGRNAITDVTPIAGLTGLVKVSVGNNKITTLPDLTRLTNVKMFWLRGNPLSAAGLAEAEKLSQRGVETGIGANAPSLPKGLLTTT